MKILHVIASADLADGGPIEGVLRIGERLSVDGHVQELLTLDAPDAPFLRGLPVTIHPRGRARPWSGGGIVGRLRRKLRRSPDAERWLRVHAANYDVVIVNGLWNYATYIARRVLPRSGVPYIVYSHGMLDPWFTQAYPVKTLAKRLIWPFNEGVLLRHADAVSFTSEDERTLAEGSFRPYRVRGRVVAYGTADAPPDEPALREAFAAVVPALGDRRFLLFLSRIHEKKGCDLLVDAFARVAAEDPALDLVIAGPDQVGLRAQLEAQARAAGIADRIHWPGMVTGDAKWGAFHACEAFVLPSHQENFGIVVAEAMACMKPVLISDRINIWREVAAVGGGFVEPDTAEGTERLLRRFLATTPAARLAMGQAGRAAFLNKFEIGRAADGVIALVEEIRHVRANGGGPARATR